MTKSSKRFMLMQFSLTSFLMALVLTYIYFLPTNQNNNDKDNKNELSFYEDYEMGYRLKYPRNFKVAEVTSSPESKTTVFESFPLAPTTIAFVSVNTTNWNSGITFHELGSIMSNIVRTSSDTSVLENVTTHISGTPAYKIVQSHASSPYGKNVVAIFVGAIRGKTSYVISSLSTDTDALQEIIGSFEFTR
jgi:hypothetical protein